VGRVAALLLTCGEGEEGSHECVPPRLGGGGAEQRELGERGEGLRR
jgi:hypothetical protein